MTVKTITVMWINNPGQSKAGKAYYNIKHGNPGDPPDKWETIWGKQSGLDGISKGDILEIVTSVGKTGGLNLVTWKKKTNGAGQELKTYQQQKSPHERNEIACLAIFKAVAPNYLGAGTFTAKDVADILTVCADGYHLWKSGLGADPYKVQMGNKPLSEDMDDEIPGWERNDGR